MEQQVEMNCFNWRNHASDYLDETLEDELKTQADHHATSCPECKTRYQHYRTILSTLAKKPKQSLPASLREEPRANPSPSRSQNPRLLSSLFHGLFNIWEQTPWYLRTLLEGSTIVIVILMGIHGAPKLKSLYETRFEKDLSDFKDSANLFDFSGGKPKESGDTSLPPLGSHAVLGNDIHNPEHTDHGDHDELSGENDSADDAADETSAEESSPGSGVNQKSQLWRFLIKTASPAEMRPLVIKTLTELGVPASTPGMGGVQVPGGIEFDLVLPQTIIPNIKEALPKLALKNTDGITGATDTFNDSEHFSWYRVKSKRKLPGGTSQVVIWLSVPN